MAVVSESRRTVRDRLVGAAMRAYRGSPLHPHWGARLAAVLNRMPGGRRVGTRTLEGVTFELDLSEVIEASLFYSGTFEVETERAISALVRPGDVAIDVGANIGYHTFRMAAGVGERGRVLAIEPMSRARNRLLRNLELNPQFGNIVVSAAAASDVDGQAEVSFQSSFRLSGDVDHAQEVVKMRTLDSLVAEHDLQRVDFIKVDVDGYEARVFRGAEKTLRRWRPELVFEVSPSRITRAGDEVGAMLDQLRDMGYSFLNEDGSDIADLDAHLSGLGELTVNLRGTVNRVD